MIVITSIFIAEAEQENPLTFEHLETVCENDQEDSTRELIGIYEGKNRVLPLE